MAQPNIAATILSSAYTKAFVHNSKDTIYANMDKAVKECPAIEAAFEVLGALEALLDSGENANVIWRESHSYDLISTSRLDRARVAIAKARGQS